MTALTTPQKDRGGFPARLYCIGEGKQMEINREELAWAAGFFDGEGHIASRTRFRRNKKWKQRDIVFEVTQKDRKVLDRFKQVIGDLGYIYGPSFVRGFKRYRFVVHRFEDVQAIIAMLWFSLSRVKRTQARNALQKYNRSI